MRNKRLHYLFFLTFVSMGLYHFSFSQEIERRKLPQQVEREIIDLMDDGNIPGLSLIIIDSGRQILRNYGFANLSVKIPVTSETLFELGSCTKAFTALAVLHLAQNGQLNLDTYISDYLPWFKVRYENLPINITVRQLLHHTSGIPWNTISKIPPSASTDALQQTVQRINGQALKHMPGEKYEYATINYDILALVVQTISGQPFEDYLQKNVIDQLQLGETTIGYPKDSSMKAVGYKIGFFSPREYTAPIFRGNYAAGYVISNANDVATWLKFQMGFIKSQMYDLALMTHQRDETVPLHHMASYAMGWEVSLNGKGEIFHEGHNPNYTAYIAFRPKEKLGIAVLANSNSTYTTVIANKVLKFLAGDKPEPEYDPGDANDAAFSTAAILLALYIFLVTVFLGVKMLEILKRKRKYEPLTPKIWLKAGQQAIVFIPFLTGIYLLPEALYGFSWNSIMVWTPLSCSVSLGLILVALSISYVTYVFGLAFPAENRFIRIIPRMLILSILSGLANMVVIILITSSLDVNNDTELKYLVFYYILTVSVYLFGRRFVQVSLIRCTMDLIYELRVKLIDRILSTTYQRFEKIDRGRVYTAMNDDASTIGDSTNMFVILTTNFFTAIGAFLYLASIAFWAAILISFLILTLTTLYFIVSKNTNQYYEAARDSRNVFMHLVNGVIEGFKEISLSKRKKEEYKQDVADSANVYNEKMSTANIRFVNASLVGETVLITILGVVAFVFPELFPEIRNYSLLSFVVVLLYLIGPVNTILNSIPAVMRFRIAWNRVQEFLKEVEVNIDSTKTSQSLTKATIDNLKLQDVEFQYKNETAGEPFCVGPIDLEIKRGEILFITGDNGSGKTTLAKLLTGLYQPDSGRLMINNKEVTAAQLGENFSAVFSPMHLFEKLYGISLNEKSEIVRNYLEVLNLSQKVELVGNSFSTIKLSGGQRKRLALLLCYLEDSPIYLFDEWAADQDPAYRKFFYNTLLQEMKQMGKIVIAITHDDRYFKVADKVLRMNHGKLEVYTEELPPMIMDSMPTRI